jgi:hypothetical protein
LWLVYQLLFVFHDCVISPESLTRCSHTNSYINAKNVSLKKFTHGILCSLFDFFLLLDPGGQPNLLYDWLDIPGDRIKKNQKVNIKYRM